MAADESGAAGPIPGTYVFDHRMSRRGYALNKMCMSLTDAANRERFLADPVAYMHQYGVPEEQIRAVQAHDWLTLTRSGGNVYMLMKMSTALGDGLYALGAQQRGETLEQFLASRQARDAR